MLLGDGSPTRHLSLLTGHEVKIELIAMELELSKTLSLASDGELLSSPI